MRFDFGLFGCFCGYQLLLLVTNFCSERCLFFLLLGTNYCFWLILLLGLATVVKEMLELLLILLFFYIFDDQSENGSEEENHPVGFGNHGGVCAICLDKIVLQETALVKGCEHAYWFVQTISCCYISSRFWIDFDS